MKNRPSSAVHAVINGYVTIAEPDGSASERLPMTSVMTAFPINEFPSAVITIPVGKPATTDAKDQAVTARDLAEKLLHFKKIEAFIQMTGEFAPGSDWPNESFKVFSGYVTGTTLARNTNTLSVVVHATHWLMDLDASSVMSDQVVASAPIAIKLPAIDTNWSSSASDPNDPDFANLSIDLWLKALKPKFIKLCDGGTVMTVAKCGVSVAQGLPELTNDTAKQRLESAAEGAFDIESVVDVPSLKFIEDLGVAIRGQVSMVATATLYNASLKHSSVWDKLREFAGLFQFAIIPTVDSAVCAPLTPSLAADEPPRHVTITADEYFTFKPGAAAYRLWRGVAIVTNHLQNFNSHDSSQVNVHDLIRNLGTTGCYIADSDTTLPAEYRERVKHGTVRYIKAPAWAHDITMAGALGAIRSTPVKNPKVNHAMMDTEKDEPQHSAGASEEFDYEQQGRLGDLYAKWYYWNQHFQSRTGELIGKLRFDIAPGSIVRIEDLDGKLYDDPAEYSYLYALVTSVRCIVDASGAKAQTAFTLSHIRRDSERAYGVDQHPFYADRWVGTVLQNVDISSGRGSNAAHRTFVPKPGSHELE